MNFVLGIVAIFTNLWLIEIFRADFFLGILAIISTTVFIVSLTQEKKSSVFLLSFLIILGTQLLHFGFSDFTHLTDDDVRVQNERLSMYPPETLQLGYYFERKTETVVIRRIVNGFVEQLDLNLYFFAGHPRPRVGVDEFGKFSFFFLPVFLYGLYKFIPKEKLFLGSFILVLLLSSLNRDKSVLGFFVLFPFFATAIYMGLLSITKR